MRTLSRDIRFAICLSAKAEDDLKTGKVYRILPDPKADEVGCLRVVDESGEDYLYSAKRFLLMDLSPKARARLLKMRF